MSVNLNSNVQELLARFEEFSYQIEEIREGIRRAALIAAEDPEMALTRARKVLGMSTVP